MTYRAQRAEQIATVLEETGCHLTSSEIVFHVKKRFRVTLTPLKVENCIRQNPERFKILLTYQLRYPAVARRKTRRKRARDKDAEASLKKARRRRSGEKAA